MKEKWDQRYSAEEFYYGLEPNEFFRDMITSLSGGKILVPADGEGRNGVFAARQGWDVTAVDYSAEGRRKALHLAALHGVELDYVLADLVEYPFPKDHFDAAGIIFCHMPPAERRIFHRKVMTSLRPGGMLFLEAFNKKQIGNTSGGPGQVVMLYDEATLREDFSGMEIVFCHELRLDLSEGENHRGEAEVVRLLARR